MNKFRDTFLLTLFLITSTRAVSQSWNIVGNYGCSLTPVQYTDISIDIFGTPYVAYSEANNSNRITVAKYNGTNWETVGSEGFYPTGFGYVKLAIGLDCIPYVLLRDSVYGNNATVMKYNGSDWVTVGTPGFSTGECYPAIAIDRTGIPNVVYSSGDTSKATVVKFDGTSWITVGAANFSSSTVHLPSIAIDTNEIPYVAYEADSAGLISVMRFNGSNWVSVGSNGFTTGVDPLIVVDHNNTPYILIGNNLSNATVMKYDGTNWVTVGNPNFLPGEANYLSLAIDRDGIPYVAFQDYASYTRASVMKYNGSSWEMVGSSGFSSGEAYYTSIAVNKIGTPYVAYADFDNENKVNVMRFGPGVDVKNVTDNDTTAVNILPNPCHESFIVNISSAINEDARIIITDILGDKITETFATTNKGTSIQFERLPGIYFLTSITSEGRKTSKLIVK